MEKLKYCETEKLKYFDDEYTVSEYKKYKTEFFRTVSESINYIFVGDRQIFAVLPENSTLIQIIVSVYLLLSIFWNDLNIILAGRTAKFSLSVGGIVESAGGSPSDSR